MVFRLNVKTMEKKFRHSTCTSSEVLNFKMWVCGLVGNFWGSYGSIVDKYHEEEKPHIEVDFKLLGFVHGNVDELLAGKKCVVSDHVVCYKPVGEKFPGQWYEETVERAVIHLPNGRVILTLGQTPHGNTVIVMK